MTSTRFNTLSKGLIRTRGKMNKTEARYAHRLEALKLAGEIAWWKFEPFTVRLSHPDTGRPATYTPDFVVVMPDGTTYIDDVKGGIADLAAVVRIKCAAEMFPIWTWRLQHWDRKAGWKEQVV